MGARAKEGGRCTSRAALALLAACATALAMLVCCAPGAFAAEGTGEIAGTVTAASSHAPLPDVDVAVSEYGGGELFAGYATTNAKGEYTVKGLRGGSYTVEFSAAFEGGDYVPQFYREASKLASATPVAVAEGSTTKEIDAELLTGGKIEGLVTEASGGAPLGGVGVTVYEPTGEHPVGFAVTDASGRYTVEGLESGSYDVEFSPGYEGFPGGEGFEETPFAEGVSGRNVIAQLYKGASSFAGATEVSVVREASTEGIDAQLQPGAEIEGTVTDESTHAPIQDALVVALGPGEKVVASVTTDRNGHYVLAGLESGSYVVGFEATHYVAQYYSGQSTKALANAVAVTRPLVTGAIDAALVPKAPASTAAPVLSGTPAVGQALSCSRGAWTGSPTPSYAYAWLRDGVPIPGAAAATYTVQPADEGNGVTCRVTATNRNGSAAAISNTLVIPVSVAPSTPRAALHVASSRVSVRGGSARLKLSCTGSRCQGSLELLERLTIRRRHRRTLHETVILGHASYVVQAGQTATVVVHLDGAAKRALSHARHHRLKAEVVATVGDGILARLKVLLTAVRHR